MKLFKMLISIVIFIGAYSCNCEDDVLENNTQLTTQSSIRTYEEALAIAKSSISMIEEAHATTRSGNTEHRSIDLSKNMVITDKTTRSANLSDTALYVFNFKDDNGFALVSANPNTEGLIAVTESGNYKDCVKENTAFAEYVSMAKRMIRDSIKPYPKEPEGRIPMVKRDTLQREQRGPYISVQWGQHYPEGVFFPNATAGCVNVAILQALSYYKYPKQIYLTYPNRDSALIKLDWNNMTSYKRSGSSRKLNRSPKLHKALSDIAHLCRQIAVYTQSNFQPNDANSTYNLDTYIYPFYDIERYHTLSTIYKAHDAFSTLDYTTSNIREYSTECTHIPLNKHEIICIQGLPDDSNSYGGHTWVIDGYIRYMVRTISYVELEKTDITESVYYNHINWGWGGTCNGFFLDNVFHTNRGYKYDTKQNILGYNYDFNNNNIYFSVYKSQHK